MKIRRAIGPGRVRSWVFDLLNPLGGLPPPFPLPGGPLAPKWGDPKLLVVLWDRLGVTFLVAVSQKCPLHAISKLSKPTQVLLQKLHPGPHICRHSGVLECSWRPPGVGNIEIWPK